MRSFRDGAAPSSAAAASENITSATEAPDNYNIRVFPNPVAGKQVTIRYSLSKPEQVRIALYNINGQAEEIINAHQQAGEQRAYWNTSNKPAGVYVARITIGNETKSVRVTVQNN